ncbi:hypothetical protein BDR04DRAFT_1118014 [Suillus decipiens]|nr:hypothetical protein BDR04DRAFT_1118014 [Suillus decipiens]
MTGMIHTDRKDEPLVVHPHPICRTKLTAALLQHSEKGALPSQTRAINEFCAAEAAKHASDVSAPIPPLAPAQPKSVLPPPSVLLPSNKCMHPDDAFKDKSVDEEHENAHMNPKHLRKKCKAPEKSPELVDGDGVLIDVDVSIMDQGSSQESKTADINTFFGATFEQMGANGKVKKH